MKTRQDNNATNHTSVVYVENKTKLSWPIRSSTDFDKNHIGQLYD